jgi:lipoprotein-anchoring transpeptidase ErfK/SrfK
MSELRVLGLAYLASASVFAMAATLATHPTLVPLMKDRAQVAAQTAGQAAVDFVVTRMDALSHHPAPSVSPRVSAHVTPIMPRRVTAGRPPMFRAADIILPDLPQLAPAPRQVAAAEQADPPAPPDTPSPVNERAALLRLKASLAPEMLKNFDMFLYVSKADKGPLAQRMYVVQKQPDESLKVAYDWAASTGREQAEVSPLGKHSFTDTPRGYYQFDPDRMYARYHSHAWNQPMPWSMFFNWQRNGLATGLAVHGAAGDDISRLGHRASAGCVHLAPENARILYQLIRGNYKGEVPRLAYDARSHTSSNSGDFQHDANGKLEMAAGYRVMIFIEDYGGENVVAALF